MAERRTPAIFPPRVRLTVRAKPRAKVSRVVRAEGLCVDVQLAALPEQGAANAELVAVIAAALGVPKRDVQLVLGGASRNKVVEVIGLAEADVVARLAIAAA